MKMEYLVIKLINISIHRPDCAKLNRDSHGHFLPPLLVEDVKAIGDRFRSLGIQGIGKSLREKRVVTSYLCSSLNLFMPRLIKLTESCAFSENVSLGLDQENDKKTESKIEPLENLQEVEGWLTTKFISVIQILNNF